MLDTEMRNPATVNIDKETTFDMLRLIQTANEESVAAVGNALPQIVRVVEAATRAIKAGGRIVYVGAGSSGRLAVLDASECPTTYGVDDSTVIALIAGGKEAVFKSSPAIEDSVDRGRDDMLSLGVGCNDLVVGLSASGGAGYVVGALSLARERGAMTASVSSNMNTPIEGVAEIAVVTPTGPEPIAGSTRMKAGNAQKMVLNMISTGAMIKSGRIRSNLMINLQPSNEKLRKRMVGIVATLLSVSHEKAIALLDHHEWRISAVLDANPIEP
jgi:N-acetylmuramic acid 6-phosphate etherase